MRITAASVFVVLIFASLSAQQPAPPSAAAPAQAAAPPSMPSGPEIAAALTRLMNNDARLRDWANLTRYREANRSLGAPKAGETRVVFMGDSITDAWPQPRYGDFFAVNTSYVGRGISGQTTPQMLIRFRPDVIDLKPKVVVILAGTNDIAGNTGAMTNEEIQGNLASMAQLAKANGIRVVMSSIQPVSAYHTNPNGAPQTQTRPMERIRAVNAWMKKYAADERHVYLDYFAAMTDDQGLLREELSADDLHPNAKGYAIMGPLAQAAIQQALR
ncbi:MAG: SGNH/GDSL hydrolase family protein [Vicinamibacterales bacterium]